MKVLEKRPMTNQEAFLAIAEEIEGQQAYETEWG